MAETPEGTFPEDGKSGQASPYESQHLRVLIANEKRDRLELLAQVVIGLGHDVIAPRDLRQGCRLDNRARAARTSRSSASA